MVRLYEQRLVTADPAGIPNCSISGSSGLSLLGVKAQELQKQGSWLPLTLSYPPWQTVATGTQQQAAAALSAHTEAQVRCLTGEQRALMATMAATTPKQTRHASARSCLTHGCNITSVHLGFATERAPADFLQQTPMLGALSPPPGTGLLLSFSCCLQALLESLFTPTAQRIPTSQLEITAGYRVISLF